MANTNAPFGVRMLNGTGSAANYQIEYMAIASNDSTKIYRVDFVKRLSTGYVAQWTATTAVSQLAGIFMGCEYLSVSEGRWVFRPYWPGADASGDVQAHIVPGYLAANMQLLIQTDSTGATFAAVGANADVNVGTGSTATGQSGSYLDIGTLNTTATLPLRVMKLWSAVGKGPGTQSGAYNWVICQLNTSGTTGI